MNHTIFPAANRRTARSARSSLVVLAVLFVALGAPLFLMGTRALRTEPRTVEALVRLPAGATTESDAKNQILAEPNVRRAIGELGLDTPSARERLAVGLSADSPTVGFSGTLHIACTRDGAADATTVFVNRLAEQFARSVRERHRAETDQAYQRAEQAVDAAEKKLHAAKKPFDDFVADRPQPTPKRPVAKSKLNPDYVALRRQLDHARARREQLLVDRTPMHPMVQAADEEIVDLERRLAAIPHEFMSEPGDLDEALDEMIDPAEPPPGMRGLAPGGVDPLDQPPGRFTPPNRFRAARTAKQPSPAGPESPSIKTFISRQQREKFFALKREVDAAQEDYRRAVARQSDAAERRLRVPRIEIVAARVVSDAAVGTPRAPRRATICFLAVLAGVLGLGMIASGVTGRRTFADAAQARAALSVPVLAVVPAADPADRRSLRRRRFEGWILVLGGLFLLAVCAAVLLTAAGVSMPF
ncbi:MAG TPA: hypothetical protein VJL29_07310 [Thermoguttaceae bacterium]|nr:hypothetical protein [Thermoguttaceae bacterium]